MRIANLHIPPVPPRRNECFKLSALRANSPCRGWESVVSYSAASSATFRTGEPRQSGCRAHPNQSEGFAGDSCSHRCLRPPRCLQPPLSRTRQRGAATLKSFRPGMRERERGVRVRDRYLAPLWCPSPRGFRPGTLRTNRPRPCKLRLSCRMNSGSRDKLRSTRRHCKELCATLRRAESSARRLRLPIVRLVLRGRCRRTRTVSSAGLISHQGCTCCSFKARASKASLATISSSMRAT
jgi:hypothetical protein